MCELPDVKFENIGAAKACFQSTLTPLGAIVRKLSMIQNQNGQLTWKINLTSERDFPRPVLANFFQVRTVLSKNTPVRGILRSINLECDESPSPEWVWVVTYSVQRISRIKKAISNIAKTISGLSTCLSDTAESTKLIRKTESLKELEKTKAKRRFFYNLRRSKAKSQPNERSTDGSTPCRKVKSSPSKDQSANTSALKTKSGNKTNYSNFSKGDTIPGTTSNSSKPKILAIAPKYDEWAIKSIVYEIKKIDIDLLTSMSLITSCKCKEPNVYPSYEEQQRYAFAFSQVKLASERITAQNINAVYLELLQRSGYTKEFVETFQLSANRESKVILRTHPITASVHLLC